jgi:hypothetical protein
MEISHFSKNIVYDEDQSYAAYLVKLYYEL